MYVCMHTCMYVYMYVCMYVRMYVLWPIIDGSQFDLTTISSNTRGSARHLYNI